MPARFTALAHHLTAEFLEEMWSALNQHGAPVLAGETMAEYARKCGNGYRPWWKSSSPVPIGSRRSVKSTCPSWDNPSTLSEEPHPNPFLSISDYPDSGDVLIVRGERWLEH